LYETRHQALLRRAAFARRLLGHILGGLLLILGSLVIGMAGYMHYEGLSALDAFLEASMLLGGMGPVHPPETEAGKLFAGLFALYAGLVFIATAALILGPIVHRVLHRFHWDKE
jgi:hypothetical protein